MKTKKFLFLTLLLAAGSLFAQDAIQIKGTIPGAGGKKVFLSAYSGEKQNWVDSARCDPSGSFTLSLRPGIAPGLYRLSVAVDRSLDLVLNREEVEFRTSGTMAPDSTFFTKSTENRIFYFLMESERRTQAKLELLFPILDYYPEKDEFYHRTADEFDRLQSTGKNRFDSVARLHPGSIALRLMRLQRTPVLASALSREERIAFLKQHFLDDADFADTLLLRSQAWPSKAIAFLALYSNKNYTQKQLESEFIKAVTVILSKASVNAETYKFLLDYFVGGFDKFHFDEVITYIADNFQDPFSCEDQARKTQLQKKLENFKKIAIGRIAPDIAVPDPKGKTVRLSEIRSEYTLLVFWSSECGHCIQMMPQLRDLYNRQKPKRWEVMTVSVDTSRTAWTSFLKEQKLSWLNTSDLKGFNSIATDEYNIFATPTMFLLDAEKKILAKPITYRELEQAMRENKLL